MNSKIVAVAVVAILIVAAVGVVVYVSDDDDTKSYELHRDSFKIGDYDFLTYSDCRLVVYGNANNDDTIDGKDMDILKAVIAGEIEWDQTNCPFIDTNADGKIDSSDAELLQNIIDKKPCSVFYENYKKHPTKVAYPTPHDNIGTTYYQQAQLAILFGLWDSVKACGNGSLNDVTNPGWEDKFSYGKGSKVDPQTVLKSGVSTVIYYTQTGTTASDMVELVESTGYDLNVLCVNHEHILPCICTYGFLFDLTDISNAYLAYADQTKASISDCMQDVADQPSVALVMLYGTATTDKIRVLGYGFERDPPGNTHNLANLFHSVPNVNLIRADLNAPSYGTDVTTQWFLDKQPDYIVLVGSGVGTDSSMNAQECWDVYSKKCEEVFGQTNAYKNGNIICASNGMMNGYSNPLVSLKLLSYVYDQIDTRLADESYQSWYNDYTIHDYGDNCTELFYRVGTGTSVNDTVEIASDGRATGFVKG